MSYDTQLTPEQEKAFQLWAAKLGKNVPEESADYDLRAAFLQNPQVDVRGHLSDIGKKPNHPTFSVESKYPTPEHSGGRWTEKNFVPSTDMMKDLPRMKALVTYLRKMEPENQFLSPYIARPEN